MICACWQIDRDIDRTFPKHTMFEEDGGFGQNALRRILQCYAILDSEVTIFIIEVTKTYKQKR